MSHLALPLRRTRQPRRTHQPARAAAWVLASLATLVLAVLALDALTGPGGWRGLGVAAAVVTPALALAALARRAPDIAARAIGIVVGVYAVASVIAVVEHDWLEELGRHGPVQLAVLVVLLVPIGLLAFTRPRAAGLALLAVTLIPVVLDVAVRTAGRPLLVVLVGPLLACAVILLTAARPTAAD